MISFGTFRGTAYGIDYSFLLLLVLAFALEGAAGLGWTCFLGICVILHEIGHAAAAKRCGCETQKIVMYAYGGTAYIANLDKASDTQMMFVAAAGPLTSLALSIVGLVLAIIFGQSAFSVGMVRINMVLAVFNMIPVFPLDGGRFAYSSLKALLKNDHAATKLMLIITTLSLLTTIVAMVLSGLYAGAVIVFAFGLQGFLYLLLKYQDLRRLTLRN